MFSSTMLSVSKTRSGIEGASILLTKSSISISFSRLSTQCSESRQNTLYVPNETTIFVKNKSKYEKYLHNV